MNSFPLTPASILKRASDFDVLPCSPDRVPGAARRAPLVPADADQSLKLVKLQILENDRWAWSRDRTHQVARSDWNRSPKQHRHLRQTLFADAVAVIRGGMQGTRRSWLSRLLERRKPKIAAR